MAIKFQYNTFEALELFNKDRRWIPVIRQVREVFDNKNRTHIFKVMDVKEAKIISGKRLPDSIIGLNFKNEIIIIDPQKWPTSLRQYSFAQVVLHEFVHVCIRNKSRNCPSWLNEGIAIFYAEQYEEKNIKEKILKSNIKYTSIYKKHYGYEMFYEYSYLLVNKLVAKYGIKTIIEKISNDIDYKEELLIGEENINKMIGELNIEIYS